MINVRDVYKSFGRVNAVKGVSFELLPAQVTALLGPNGAGKSTTIRMITGYIPPDRGQVLISGKDSVEHSVFARKQIGYLPESAPLYPEMKTSDFLFYRTKLFDIHPKKRRQAVDRVIEQCWLKEVRGRRIGKLSKGYKQRVGLAAALVHEPPILILDEPTNGLDPAQIRETRELIRELAKSRTVLVSSHILPEVERFCDRVIIIAGGQVRADGAPRELVAKARQTATYIVQCKRSRPGDDERAYKIWANIPWVEDIQPNTFERGAAVMGWSLWLLTAKAGSPDLRESIASTASQNGILVRELRQELPSLEKVFMKLMEGETETDPGPVIQPPRVVVESHDEEQAEAPA